MLIYFVFVEKLVCDLGRLNSFFFFGGLKGSSPQVTKGTKVVLPFRLTQREFTRAPQGWDVRLHQQDGLIITLQVSWLVWS